MNKNIVIIGATSGIGKALFEKYATDGNQVGIVGRRTNLLEELREQYPANTLTATADITKTDEAEKAIRDLSTRLGHVDLAIVCSGTGEINPTLDYALERPTLDTNVMGWTFVVDTLYHIFEQQGHGHLVAITSAGGLRGEPIPPTAQRKPTKSTTWKPCARRLSRLAAKSPSLMSVPASLIRQWPRATASSG